jgi:hypothetical protein
MSLRNYSLQVVESRTFHGLQGIASVDLSFNGIETLEDNPSTAELTASTNQE